MKRSQRLVLLALFILIMLPSSQATAAAPLPENFCLTEGNPLCLSFFDGLGALASEWGTTLAVSTIGGFDMVIWTADRLALAVYDMAVNGIWLEIFREDLLGNLSDLMPDVLRQITLGPTGIMYIALSLAGILMTIPLINSGTGRLVKPERVIIWGVLLTALFISGTVGYDLIGGIEDLRVSVVRQTMGSEDTTSSVENLILTPMLASPSESGLDLNNLVQLPTQFLTAYFPDIEKEEVSVRVVESGWFGVINTEIETSDSKIARISGAAQSLLYALLSLGSSAVVLGFALSFIFLGIAALILIIFLIASLPLGFFEFGNVILMKIVEQYVQIAAISLALALFMRVSGGLMGALPAVSSPSAMVEWLLLIGSLFMANQMLWGAARKVLTSSFSTFSNSIRSAIGVPMDQPGMLSVTSQKLGQAAVSGIAGAITGGTPGAIFGAVGGLMGSTPMFLPNSGARSASESTQQQSIPRGDVFIGNGFSQANAVDPVQAPAQAKSNVVNSAPPVLPLQQSISKPSVLSASAAQDSRILDPLKSITPDLTAKVQASKLLSPDEK